MICPADPLIMPVPDIALVFGRPKFVWLMMLNASVLHVALSRSVIGKCFSSATSKSATPGPMSVFLPRSPYVPAIGSEKAHGSNQCFAFPTRVPTGNPGVPAGQDETP